MLLSTCSRSIALLQQQLVRTISTSLSSSYTVPRRRQCTPGSTPWVLRRGFHSTRRLQVVVPMKLADIGEGKLKRVGAYLGYRIFTSGRYRDTHTHTQREKEREKKRERERENQGERDSRHAGLSCCPQINRYCRVRNYPMVCRTGGAGRAVQPPLRSPERQSVKRDQQQVQWGGEEALLRAG